MKTKILGFFCAAAMLTTFVTVDGMDLNARRAEATIRMNGQPVSGEENYKRERFFAAKVDFVNNLPEKMYEGFGAGTAIPAAEAAKIPAAFKTLLTFDGTQAIAANDGTSKALEVLFGIITTGRFGGGNAIANTDTAAKFDAVADGLRHANNLGITVTTTTAKYLDTLARILVKGRNGQDDFSIIEQPVNVELKAFIQAMIYAATREEMGLK